MSQYVNVHIQCTHEEISFWARWRTKAQSYVWAHGVTSLVRSYVSCYMLCSSSLTAFKWQIRTSHIKNCIILEFAWVHSAEHELVSLAGFSMWCVYIENDFFISWKSPVPTVIHLLKAISLKKAKSTICFVAFVSVAPNRPHPSSWRQDRKLIMKPTSCLMNLQTHKHTHACAL